MDMIEVLAGMQIARKVTEEQFALDDQLDRSTGRRRRERSPSRGVSFFRRTFRARRESGRPGLLGRADVR
jgi:hypothetical protein